MYMERSTWTQVRDYFKEHDLVIIGVGSTECHGRHNPLGTDTMAPDKILELLEQRDGTYLVAPTLPYGATDDLVGYPGTVSLGVQGLYDVLSSITRQLRAYGARRFVFLNGHGGNVKSLSMASMDLNDAGCLAAVVNWWRLAPQLNPAWGGGHGGAMETSANLAIDPASVDMSQVTDENLLPDIGDDMPSTGWNSVSFGGAEVEFPRRLAPVCKLRLGAEGRGPSARRKRRAWENDARGHCGVATGVHMPSAETLPKANRLLSGNGAPRPVSANRATSVPENSRLPRRTDTRRRNAHRADTWPAVEDYFERNDLVVIAIEARRSTGGTTTERTHPCTQSAAGKD